MNPAAAAPLLLAVLASGSAAACGEGIAGAQRLSGGGDVLAFAPRPAPWALGRPFSIELQVCPRAGVAPPDELRVDARMPEHGHGMNYRPSLVALGGGRWRADGLLLHMAGRWELSFELRRGEQVQRLVQVLQLR